MSEEKLKILEMLKEGKISSEEAIELLKQVSDEDGRPNRNHWRNHPHRHQWQNQWRPPYTPDLDWIDSLRSTVIETARNAMFPDEILFGGKPERFTASSQNIGNGIRTLMLEGKNAPVRLESYGGDRIEIEAYYKARINWNPHFAFTEESGVFSLRYDDNALYMLGISVRVPETAHIGVIRLKNKNALISVDGIKAEKIELSTKNDSIKISDVTGEYLYCETKSAPIVLDDVQIREIDAQTSNARISLDDTEALRARLETSNAKIDVKDSDIVQLYARTSNSPLRFDDPACKKHEPAQSSDYSVEAITSNAQISIRLPRGRFEPETGLGYSLRASTTNGGVFSELNDLEYQVNERNYVEARTLGYEMAQCRLSLNLQTTNGGIYIKR